MSEKLVPLWDHVLLRREVKTKTDGGIILPENAAKREAATRCEVIALGPSCEADLSPGDTVIIAQYAGSWINEKGKGAARAETETFVIKETEILCKVEHHD